MAQTTSLLGSGQPQSLATITEWFWGQSCLMRTYLRVFYSWLGFCGGSDSKESAYKQKTQVWSLGWEDPLEQGIATHSSIFAWKIPQTKEPGWLQSIGSQRVGHDWETFIIHGQIIKKKKKRALSFHLDISFLSALQILPTLWNPTQLQSPLCSLPCHLLLTWLCSAPIHT